MLDTAVFWTPSLTSFGHKHYYLSNFFFFCLLQVIYVGGIQERQVEYLPGFLELFNKADWPSQIVDLQKNVYLPK